jgi:hypothetical protein
MEMKCLGALHCAVEKPFTSSRSQSYLKRFVTMSSSSQKARPRSPFLPRNIIKARARCKATQVKAQNPLPRQKPRQPQLLSSSLSPRPIYRFKRDSRKQHVIDAPRFFPTVHLPTRLPPRHSFRLTHRRRMIFRPTKNWRPHSLASQRAGNPGRN